jgi:pimeloyl-ACP methyl ester carboxylesterase
VKRFFKWLGLSLLALIALLIVAIFAFGFRTDLSLEALKPRYTSAQSRFVEINGLNVHYREQGPAGAPVLVLLHGSGASLHTWEGWEARLKNDLRLISIDLPAHGLTGPWPKDGDYTMDGFARFLESFAQKLALQRFSIAGNSMGGAIGWTYTSRYPQRVDKLILIDSAGYPRSESQRFFGFAGFPLADVMLRWVTPYDVVERTVRGLYGDPAKVDGALVERYRDLVRREGNRGVIGTRMRQFNPDPALLKSVQAPVLIMWGGKDRLLLPADAFRFQNDIANTTLKLYSELGHMPMEENPDITATDARKFLLGR